MNEKAGSSARTGGCLCGGVRYEVSGPLRAVVGCHCSQCRRTTGHFMAATAAKRADFALVSSDSLQWYSSSPDARRGFCNRCGSTLFWDGHGLPHMSIAAGTLDDTSGLAIACHIFVADKGQYYSIEPGTHQVAGGKFLVPF